jgi:hypothetical protein
MNSPATNGSWVDREMTAESRKREVFANPFFVVLMAASVVFVLTVLAYLISPAVLEAGPGKPPPTPRSLAMATWIDHNAPWVLAVEIAIMLVTGVVAMVTDPWFTRRSQSKPPARG